MVLLYAYSKHETLDAVTCWTTTVNVHLKWDFDGSVFLFDVCYSNCNLGTQTSF